MPNNWTILIITVAFGLIPLRVSLLWAMRQWHTHLLKTKTPLQRDTVQQSQTTRELKTLWLGLSYDSIVLLSLVGLGWFKLAPLSWLGLGIIFGAHICLVEPIYYLVHRLYHSPTGMRYLHRGHHNSIVTQPETAVSFFLPERLLYTIIFTPPLLIASILDQLSLEAIVIYILFIDIVNIWGHFNVAIIPKWWHHSILKYVIYSPQYHSVHHRKHTYNYSLFMPVWDIIFGTATYQEDL